MWGLASGSQTPRPAPLPPPSHLLLFLALSSPPAHRGPPSAHHTPASTARPIRRPSSVVVCRLSSSLGCGLLGGSTCPPCSCSITRA